MEQENSVATALSRGWDGWASLNVLRQPLSRPLLLAIAVMLALALSVVVDRLRAWNDIEHLVSHADLVADIGDYVHELQIERGMSSLYLGGDATQPPPELRAQRDATDERARVFRHTLGSVLATAGAPLRDGADAVDAALRDIPRVREAVDSRTIRADESISQYSMAIARLLALRETLSETVAQDAQHNRIASVGELGWLKERTGQIRAIGSEAFALRRLEPDGYRQLVLLAASQAERQTKLLRLLPPAQRSRFERIYGYPEMETVTMLQRRLLADGPNGRLLAGDAEPWFSAMTAHINRIKEVEDAFRDDLRRASVALKRETAFNLASVVAGVIVVLAVAILALWRREFVVAKRTDGLQASLLAEQERSQMILDSMSEAVFVAGSDGRIEYANPAMISAFGEVACRKGVAAILPCVGSDGCALSADERAASDRRCDEAISPLNGRGYAIDCVRFPAREGRESRLVVLTDVTARILTEKRLATAKETAESVSRRKSEMLANMSHELRTPLNAIIGFSEMMIHQGDGPRDDTRNLEYLHDIHVSGLHLLDLINDILDVSAIEAGKVELQTDHVVIDDVVVGAMRLIGPRAKKGKVPILIDLAGDMPLFLGDGRRLKQVLLNLLSNAVKFTPEYGTVTLRTAIEPDGSVVIVVEDTGVGMTKAELAEAMEPFGQIDSIPDRKHEGTGLGLPLAKRLVELHDGEMVVDSVKGEGTAVTIRFPPERSCRC